MGSRAAEPPLIPVAERCAAPLRGCETVDEHEGMSPGGGGTQEAGWWLLGVGHGVLRAVAAPPPPRRTHLSPASAAPSVAGVGVPARGLCIFVVIIAIATSLLDSLRLVLAVVLVLRLGGCWRSADPAGDALGSFSMFARGCPGLAADTAPLVVVCAITAVSSLGLIGQLREVVSRSRATPRPAAPPYAGAPMAG